MLLNQNLQLYQAFSVEMEKFVDSKLKGQIKQLINMQSLLDQYDRQNSFLNKQVLQLLEENKVLKIDKIKQNIVTQLTDVTQYKKKTKPSKTDHLDLFKKLPQRRQNEKLIQKPKLKDQSVQVVLAEPDLMNLKLGSLQLRKESSDAFSFGSRTGRCSPEQKKQQNKLQQPKHQSPPKITRNSTTSPDKILSTDCKQPYKIQLLRSPIEHFQEKERQKWNYSREQKRSDCLVRENNFSRQNSSIKRNRLRSSHAIAPSRKIEPIKSSKNLFKREGDKHIQIQRAQSFSCLKNESIQKKKRFIDLVSSKQKKTSWQPKEWENVGCC